MHNIKYDFSWLDYSAIIAYILIVLLTGFIFSRRKLRKSSSQKEDFLLAGRQVTLPVFIATLVATWYGNILGVGEFVYNNGLVAWVCFGLPYYIAAALFALFIAKKVRNSNVHTIPEQISKKYGRTAGWISSLIVLIITIPSAYILMLGILVQLFTGWQLWICIVTGALISLVYLFKGGFRADIFANVIQFIMMYLGFGILLLFCIINIGSPTSMLSKLPQNHLLFFGNISWQVIIAWYIISLQTFVDPSFHQRSAAAKTPQVAQRGILLSIGCWAVFDFLTLMTGLYARTLLNNIDPVMSFPALGASILPYFFKGFFVAAMLAPIMSSLDGYAFISAATIGNDILSPIINRKRGGERYTTKFLTNIGLFITSAIGIIMAVALPSAVQLIYKTASVAVPGLLVPLLVSFSNKYYFTKKNVIILMLVSAFTAAAWTAGNISAAYIEIPFKEVFAGVEPMLPGIITSLILGIIFIKKNR